MRLFIACPLPEELVARLAKAQRDISLLASHARLTPQAQMHLTLRFIGEADEQTYARIAAWFAALPPLAQDALAVHQTKYGSFPGRDGTLVYAGLQCAPELAHYVSKMENDLRSLGVPPETKPWLAHITLARKASISDRDALRDLPISTETFRLRPPVLFLSEFIPGGVRYTPLLSK